MFRSIFLHHLHRGYAVRPRIWLSVATTAVLAVSYLSLSSMLVQVSTPPAVAVAATKSPTASTGSTPVASAGAATITPACTPSPFTTPSALDLTNAAQGATVQYEADIPYRIYGTTAAQLSTQISLCAPRTNGSSLAEFTGETAYTLSWQYSTLVSEEGCHVSGIKVGMHIATTLPLWMPADAASPDLRTRWQNFMLGLTTHEAGHAALDRQYAATIANHLYGLPVMSCGAIASSVSATVNQDAAALNQANDTYDTTTNHGATQGAVLP